MDKLRKVAASGQTEALEVLLSGAVLNADGSYNITVGSVATWPTDVDFITFARTSDGKVDEATRVVWLGSKVDDTNIKATRTGGSTSHVPAANEFATVVPSHRWANDLIEGITASLPLDGTGGIKAVDGTPVVIAISDTQPAPISGKTIIWLRPLE